LVGFCCGAKGCLAGLETTGGGARCKKPVKQKNVGARKEGKKKKLGKEKRKRERGKEVEEKVKMWEERQRKVRKKKRKRRPSRKENTVSARIEQTGTSQTHSFFRPSTASCSQLPCRPLPFLPIRLHDWKAPN